MPFLRETGTHRERLPVEAESLTEQRKDETTEAKHKVGAVGAGRDFNRFRYWLTVSVTDRKRETVRSSHHCGGQDEWQTPRNGAGHWSSSVSQLWTGVEESQQYSTINTHKGLYQFSRVPFGVASAPTIFQRTIDTVLQGIPDVLCYLDDLLITGITEKEHLQNLEGVLRWLQNQGNTIKWAKCRFLKASVECLGYKIDADGIHTITQK